MTETLPDLLLIGCGKMGGAMLAGWLERGLSRAVVVEPHAPAAAAFAGRATIVPDAAAIPADFHPAAVILAIKPQEAPATLIVATHDPRLAGRLSRTLRLDAGRLAA